MGRKICTSLITCLLCVSAAVGAGTVDFADPFIYYEDGVYYAYGTNAAHGIRCAVSTDLLNWKYAGNAAEGLALHMDDVYGKKWFWAPEVYKVNGKYYMMYSGDERACIAVSDSPLGPFAQEEKRPYFKYGGSLDNTLVFDEKGRPMMFYVRTNDGNNIWSVELSDDLLSVKEETMRYCIRADKPWELKQARVVEGPFILRHNGTYYMTYSANDYRSAYYGIGYATSPDLRGLWTKFDGNPILQLRRGLPGLGHHSFFTDKDGKLRIVFHTHAAVGRVHPRHMIISSVDFGKDGTLRITDDFIFPQLIK